MLMKVKRCNLLKYSKITVLHNIGEKGSVKSEPVKTDPIILPHHYSIIIIFIYNIIIIEEKREREGVCILVHNILNLFW